MNFKLFSMAFITAGIILTSASIATANAPVILESTPVQGGISFLSSHIPPRPTLLGQMPSGPLQKLSEIPGINLTEEQKNKLKEIQQETRSQVDEILTSEQVDDFKQAMQEGKNPPDAMKSLNLSSEQKQKMRELMVSQRGKLDDILTDEQREKLREFKEKMPKGNMPFGNVN
jgi:periplasmic protein CpxP/Spy